MKKDVILPVLCFSLITTGVLLAVYTSIQTKAQIPPGIPRGDILIFRTPAMSSVGDDMNPIRPGNRNIPIDGGGYIFEPLYALNLTSLDLVFILAAGPPIYTDNYTVLRIPIRPGVYWSDGVEFTAEDVAFTLMLHCNTPGTVWYGYASTWIEEAYTEDKYTVVIKLKRPNPKFHMNFWQVAGLGGPIILPKHIWEKVEDPLKFNFNPPVGTGPYVLESYDPKGYWALLKRRDDWQRSATGIVFGKPAPKYILRMYYTPDDPKQVIAISRHELDATELTFELWDTAKTANPFLTAFWKDFPYVYQYDVCDHGPYFNCAKYPLNITDVRWALTLAINMTEVNIMALEGRGRLSAFGPFSVPHIERIYAERLLPWVREFTLDDGYKPFDESILRKLEEYAKAKGYKLTVDPVTIWGLGWWKYDPEEATKLLKKYGFYKDEQGRWHLPNGEIWTLHVVIPAYHALASRLGFATVEQWRKFGIEVIDEAVPSAVHVSKGNTGDFDVTIWWLYCAKYVDVWEHLQAFHSRYVKPIGEVATSNQFRWSNSEFDKLIDELATLSPEDPKVIDIGVELAKILIREMPGINYIMGTKLLVFDTYVWTGWPTADNRYWDPCYWNPNWMLPILTRLKPTGNVPTTEIPITPPTITYVSAYAKTYISTFTGIDGKSYGPYKAGETMVIPKDDADRLVAAGLATYTPPVPAEISEAISALLERVSRLESTLREVSESISTMRTELTNAISSLSRPIDALSGQLSSVTNIMMGIGVVTIVLVVVAILMIVRRK